MGEDTIERRLTAVEERELTLERNYTGVCKDVALIKTSNDNLKERIENGISKTLSDTFKAVTDLTLVVTKQMTILDERTKENSGFRKKLIAIFIWIGGIAVGGGLIALAFTLIKAGANIE